MLNSDAVKTAAHFMGYSVGFRSPRFRPAVIRLDRHSVPHCNLKAMTENRLGTDGI